jgi:type III secretion protein L
MTFHMLHLGPQGALASDRPIIKAAEHESLADVFALLARLRTVEAAQAEAAREAMADARARGHAEGFADGRAAFAKAIAEMAAEASLHRQAEEEEIAALAMAAVRQMVGAIGDEAMMAGIARRAVATVAPSGPILVETSEAMLPAVETALAEAQEDRPVNIRADPALADHQCRIAAGDGRIIADLSVQLAALEQRWGVAHVD